MNDNDLPARVLALLAKPKVRILHEEFLAAHKEELQKTFVEPENNARSDIAKAIKDNHPAVNAARRQRRALSRKVHQKLLDSKINPRP